MLQVFLGTAFCCLMSLLLNLVTFCGKLSVAADSMKTNTSFTVGSPVDMFCSHITICRTCSEGLLFTASYCAQISVVICVCMIVVVNNIKLGATTPRCTTESTYVRTSVAGIALAVHFPS